MSGTLIPPEKVIEELKHKEMFRVGEGQLTEKALKQLNTDELVKIGMFSV